MSQQTRQPNHSLFQIAVFVAALGYFVDIYDLLLFTIVREPSLKGVGVTDPEMMMASTSIINWQMFGLLLGGILWGVMGDKKGRLSVLFGSIILYSIGNFLNGYVQTVGQYAAARFVAGIGLAGELGAGITLVSELLHKKNRGIGTSLVAGFGLFGAVFAYGIYKLVGDWRVSYWIGAGLGVILLILRVSVAESGMFHAAKHSGVMRGNFLKFFTNPVRFRKYMLAILIGLPTWFIIGILVNLSNRFAKEMYTGSAIDSGRPAQFSAIKGAWPRGLARWQARASSSLPVPVSPWISRGASRGAMRRASRITAASRGLAWKSASKPRSSCARRSSHAQPYMRSKLWLYRGSKYAASARRFSAVRCAPMRVRASKSA